jgi:putative transcriptional regulator
VLERSLAPESYLKGQFLLAMPALAGSYFGSTLTYLCEHNESGAMGIMVNRPAGLTLGELFDQLEIPVADARCREVEVLEGGPVAADRGFILHTDDARFDSSLGLDDGLMLTTAREVLEAIAAGNGPRQYLVALGYAGWGETQLEEEMKDNAWLNCPASGQVLFQTPFPERVSSAAAQLGIDFNLISGQAGHA